MSVNGQMLRCRQGRLCTLSRLLLVLAWALRSLPIGHPLSLLRPVVEGRRAWSTTTTHQVVWHPDLRNLAEHLIGVLWPLGPTRSQHHATWSTPSGAQITTAVHCRRWVLLHLRLAGGLPGCGGGGGRHWGALKFHLDSRWPLHVACIRRGHLLGHGHLLSSHGIGVSLASVWRGLLRLNRRAHAIVLR